MDAQTGEKLVVESSVDASRSKSLRFVTSKERRLKIFEKNIVKIRAKKEKERILMEYNKKVTLLKEVQQ